MKPRSKEKKYFPKKNQGQSQNQNKKQTQNSNPERKKTQEKITFRPGPLQVVVNNYSEEWLSKSFDLVYQKEILAKGTKVELGSEVEIVSSKGKVLGVGIFADGELPTFAKKIKETNHG